MQFYLSLNAFRVLNEEKGRGEGKRSKQCSTANSAGAIYSKDKRQRGGIWKCHLVHLTLFFSIGHSSIKLIWLLSWNDYYLWAQKS